MSVSTYLYSNKLKSKTGSNGIDNEEKIKEKLMIPKIMEFDDNIFVHYETFGPEKQYQAKLKMYLEGRSFSKGQK